MNFKLKISSQNQITLPASLIKELNLSSGNFIEIVKIDGRYVLQTYRDVLNELDILTQDLQKKTKRLQKENPNWNIDDLINAETKLIY